MSDLTEFLLARIAEDEAVAKEATPGVWSFESDACEDIVWTDTPHPDASIDWQTDLPTPYVAQTSYDQQSGTTHNSSADGRHIARWSGVRVLAECEAKRRILEIHADDSPFCGWSHDSGSTHDMFPGEECDTRRALALPYADHPDYREEWRP